MTFEEFSKNYLSIIMVLLFQHFLYNHHQGYFLLFLSWNLKDSESCIILTGSSLQYYHKLPDVIE